jgi:hypothetical protein
MPIHISDSYVAEDWGGIALDFACYRGISAMPPKNFATSADDPNERLR